MKKLILAILTALLVLSIGVACAESGVVKTSIPDVDPTFYAETWNSEDPVEGSFTTRAPATFKYESLKSDLRYSGEPGLWLQMSMGSGSAIAGILPQDATDIRVGVAVIPAENLSKENWDESFVIGNEFASGNTVYGIFNEIRVVDETVEGKIKGDDINVSDLIKANSLNASVVLNMQMRNYERDIAVRGVVEYKTADGQTAYAYSDGYGMANLSKIADKEHEKERYDAKNFVLNTVNSVAERKAFNENIRSALHISNEVNKYSPSKDNGMEIEGLPYDLTADTVSVIYLGGSHDQVNEGIKALLTDVMTPSVWNDHVSALSRSVTFDSANLFVRSYVDGALIDSIKGGSAEEIADRLVDDAGNCEGKSLKVVLSFGDYEDFLTFAVTVEEYVVIEVKDLQGLSYTGESVTANNLVDIVLGDSSTQFSYAQGTANGYKNAGEYSVKIVSDKKILSSVSTPTDSFAIDFEINKASAEENPAFEHPNTNENGLQNVAIEATYGDNLYSIALPDGWSWKSGQTIDKAGNGQIFYAKFQSTNFNYESMEEEGIVVNVLPANISARTEVKTVKPNEEADIDVQDVETVNDESYEIFYSDYEINENNYTTVERKAENLFSFNTKGDHYGYYCITAPNHAPFFGVAIFRIVLINDETRSVTVANKVYNGAPAVINYSTKHSSHSFEHYRVDANGETRLDSAPVDVGSYYVLMILPQDDIYMYETVKSETYQISPSEALAVPLGGISVYDGAYDGALHCVSINRVTGVNGANLSNYTVEYSYSGTDYEKIENGNFYFKNVGEYEVNYKVSAPNYKDLNASATIKISEAVFTYSFKNDYVYDGTTQGAQINVSTVGDEHYTVRYKTSESNEFSNTVPTFTDAGSYFIYFEITASNHKTVSDSHTIVVAQAENTYLTVTANDIITSYTGANHIASVNSVSTTVFGGSVALSGYTVKYSYNGTSGLVAPQFRNVSESTTVAYTVSHKNYKDYTGEIKVEISPVNLTLTYNSLLTLTYNKSERTVEDFLYGNLTVTGVNNEPFGWNDVTISNVEVGTDAMPEAVEKTFTVSLKDSVGNNANYNVTEKTVSVKIEKADPTVTFTTPSSVIYNGQVRSVTEFSEITVTTLDGTALFKTTSDTEIKNAGEYKNYSFTVCVLKDGEEDKNYNTVTYQGWELLVEKETPTLNVSAKANNLGYKASAYSLTDFYTITLSTCEGNKEFAIDGSELLNAGTYSNYAYTLTVLNGSVADTNFNTVSGVITEDLVIEKANLTVSETALPEVFYTATQYNIDNFYTLKVKDVNGNDITDSASLKKTSGTALDANEYALVVSLDFGGNYNVWEKTYNVTVKPATLSVNYNSTNVVYDGSAHSSIGDFYTFTVTAHNSVITSKTVIEFAEAQSFVNAGTTNNVAYTATVMKNGVIDTNYVALQSTVNVIIQKAVLTIVPNPVTVIYGATPKGNGATINGFVSDAEKAELESSIKYDYSFTYIAQTTPAGTVANAVKITNIAYSLQNYTVTSTSADLTVEKAKLTVTYSEREQTYTGNTYKYSDFLYLFTVEGTLGRAYKVTKADGSALEITDAGVYNDVTLFVSVLDSDGTVNTNFETYKIEKTLTVNKAAGSVTIPELSCMFGGFDGYSDAQAKANIVGDAQLVSVKFYNSASEEVSYNKDLAVGDYIVVVTISFSDDGNYSYAGTVYEKSFRIHGLDEVFFEKATVSNANTDVIVGDAVEEGDVSTQDITATYKYGTAVALSVFNASNVNYTVYKNGSSVTLGTDSGEAYVLNNVIYFTQVGEYSIQAIASGQFGDDTFEKTLKASVKINKREFSTYKNELNIEVPTFGPFVYGDTMPALPTYDFGSWTYVDNNITSASTVGDVKQEGYQYNVKFKPNYDYYEEYTTTVKIVVNPFTINQIIWDGDFKADGETKPYTGEEYTVSAYFVGVGGEELPLYVTITGGLVRANTSKDAGKYKATVTLADLNNDSYSNYQFASGIDGELEFSISPVKVSFVWTVPNDTTYSGSVINPDIENIQGLITGESLKYTIVAEDGYDMISADEQIAKIVINDKNYVVDTEIVAETKKYQILQRELSAASVKWEPKSYVYSGTSKQAEAPKATVDGVAKDDKIWLKVAFDFIEAGTHIATATLTGVYAKNYCFSTPVTCEYEITPEEINVIWVEGSLSKEYNGEAQSPEIQKTTFTVGETIYTFTFEIGQGTNAGTYNGITASILKVKAENGATLNISNFELTNDSTNFEITKKEITVDWPVGNYTYNNTEQKPTATAKLVNGFVTLNVSVTAKDSNDRAGISAGEHVATASLPDSYNKNYILSNNNITKTYTYTIAQVAPTFTVAFKVGAPEFYITANKLSDYITVTELYGANLTVTYPSIALSGSATYSYTITDTEGNYTVTEGVLGTVYFNKDEVTQNTINGSDVYIIVKVTLTVDIGDGRSLPLYLDYNKEYSASELNNYIKEAKNISDLPAYFENGNGTHNIFSGLTEGFTANTDKEIEKAYETEDCALNTSGYIPISGKYHGECKYCKYDLGAAIVYLDLETILDIKLVANETALLGAIPGLDGHDGWVAGDTFYAVGTDKSAVEGIENGNGVMMYAHRTVTITLTKPSDLTYDRTAKLPGITATYGESGSLNLSAADYVILTSGNDAINVGNNEPKCFEFDTAKFYNDYKYYTISNSYELTISYSISPAHSGLKIASSFTKEYDGEGFKLSGLCTVSDLVKKDGLKITIKVNDVSITDSLIDIDEYIINAGRYLVNISINDASNYADTSQTTIVDITKRVIDAIRTPEEMLYFKYDGTDMLDKLADQIYFEYNSKKIALELLLAKNTSGYGINASASTQPYFIKVKLSETVDALAKNFTFVGKDAGGNLVDCDEFTLEYGYYVDPQEIEIVWTETSKTYTGLKQSPEIQKTTFTVGETTYTFTFTIGQKTDVGIYEDVTASILEVKAGNGATLDDSNFVLSNALTDFEITKKEITVDWVEESLSKEYNGEAQSPEIKETTFTVGETIYTFTFEVGQGTNAGTYNGITASILEVKAGNGATLDISNFVLTNDSTDFEITKKKITVDWVEESLSKEYNGEDQSPEIKETTFTVGETTYTFTFETDQGTDAKIYEITASISKVEAENGATLDNSNFVLSNALTDFEITKKAITVNNSTVTWYYSYSDAANNVKWEDSDGKYTYNGEVQKPVVIVNGVNGEIIYLDVTDTTDAGSYTASPAFNENAYTNYTLATDSATITAKNYDIAKRKVKAWDGTDNTTEFNYTKGGITVSASSLYANGMKLVWYNDAGTALYSDTTKAVDENDMPAVYSTYDGETTLYGNVTLTTGNTYKVTFTAFADNSNYVFVEDKNWIYLKYRTIRNHASASSATEFFTIEEVLAKTEGSYYFMGNLAEGGIGSVTTFTKLDGVYTNFVDGKANYTLAAGVKLYMPYDDSGNYNPGSDDGKRNATNGIYSILHVPAHVAITVDVDAEFYIGGSMGRIEPKTDTYGRVSARSMLFNDGTITIKGYMWTYGYTRGSGLIEVNPAGEFTDLISVYDFKGGTFTSMLVNAQIFPFENYTVHNNACKTKVYKNGFYKVYCVIYAASMTTPLNIIILGPGGLFKQTGEGAYIIKSVSDGTMVDSKATVNGVQKTTKVVNYIFQEDFSAVRNNPTELLKSHQAIGQYDEIEIHGDSSDSSLAATLAGYTMKTGVGTSGSGTCALPISYMNITIASGTTNLDSVSYKFMPGTRLTVKDGATLNIGNTVYLYTLEQSQKDNYERQDENGNRVTNFGEFVNSSGGKGRFATTNWDHAQLIVQGKVVVNEGASLGGIVRTRVYGDQVPSNGELLIVGDSVAKILHTTLLKDKSTLGSIIGALVGSKAGTSNDNELSVIGYELGATINEAAGSLVPPVNMTGLEPGAYRAVDDTWQFGYLLTLKDPVNDFEYEYRGAYLPNPNDTEYILTEDDVKLKEDPWYEETIYLDEAYATPLTEGTTINATSQKTYYIKAKSGVNQITISLNANSGEGGTSFTRYQGQIVNLFDFGLTKEGHTLLGFADTQSATTAKYTTSYEVVRDATLYAVWAENEYVVMGRITSTDYGKYINVDIYVGDEVHNYVGVNNEETYCSVIAKFGQSVRIYVKSNNTKELPNDEIELKVNDQKTSLEYTFSMPASEVSFVVDVPSCFASGSLVNMADGTTKKIEDVKADDIVLAWDFFKGEYVAAKLLMIVNHGESTYNIINLEFEDGTKARIIGSHGFFCEELNDYVYINEFNVNKYIGYSFIQSEFASGDNGYGSVKLVNAYVTTETTGSYSLVTQEHYNVIIEGMLTTTPPSVGIGKYFEVGEGMKYDEEQMQKDIETYGLLDYSVVADYVTYEQFVAANGQYYAIAVGKGYITLEEAIKIAIIYGEYFVV